MCVRNVLWGTVVAFMRIKTHKLINIIYTCASRWLARAVPNGPKGGEQGVAHKYVCMQNMNLNFKQIFLLPPPRKIQHQKEFSFIFVSV